MKNTIIATLLSLVFTIIGCEKVAENHPCYNSSIANDRPCNFDCPGFEGCDGKTYCNECEAAKEGIGPK